jgi:hypothetical protein
MREIFMSGLTRERGDTVIGPRTSQSVLSSLLYREISFHSRDGSREEPTLYGKGVLQR